MYSLYTMSLPYTCLFSSRLFWNAEPFEKGGNVRFHIEGKQKTQIFIGRVLEVEAAESSESCSFRLLQKLWPTFE
ncbi:hypothetical protein VNO77_25616 [Canavalia gladiata]|uniref:Uncharacterized protein n=1 Tax=Canavalia gladiata TaxID=3824 RepID=A0AAN9L8G2_CANGL